MGIAVHRKVWLWGRLERSGGYLTGVIGRRLMVGMLLLTLKRLPVVLVIGRFCLILGWLNRAYWMLLAFRIRMSLGMWLVRITRVISVNRRICVRRLIVSIFPVWEIVGARVRRVNNVVLESSELLEGVSSV